MKSDVMPSIVEKSILNTIVEVKETLASGITPAKKKRRSFGVADIWKIRRNVKTASSMVRV